MVVLFSDLVLLVVVGGGVNGGNCDVVVEVFV